MKKMASAMILAIGLTSSISALATTYQFNCPNPVNVLSSNTTVLYSPYDSSSDMPQSLSGDPYQMGVTSGWIGQIKGSGFVTINDQATTFSAVFASSAVGVVNCQYKVTGTDKSGQTNTVTVDMQPAVSNYLELYTYSLSSGSTYDISTKIIAIDNNK